MSRRIDRFLYQKEKSFRMKVLLFPLYLLSLLYGVAVRTRVGSYSIRLRRTKRLPCPVISVGNIVAGGTGKTPLVIALARRLKERGISIAILSRGYKGRDVSRRWVGNGGATLLSAEEAGDEPFLMAETLKDIPVLVGKDRFTSGRMALQKLDLQGFLLDDGYQHLRLHRDLNILLIDSRIVFGDGHLLPRGILREPLSHIRRAHLLLLTKMEETGGGRSLEERLHAIHPSLEIFHSHYEPLGWIGPENEREDLQRLGGSKALAVSGIANPGYFALLLRKSGIGLAGEAVFPDHHLFTEKDLASIRNRMKGIDWVVTTEKDLVRLKRLDLRDLPIRALRIEMRIREEERFYRRVLEIF
jgi:tetraacyldisaccharide 4'-kinase